jgi:molybdenum cofactor cytidylyltransferase
MARTNQLRLSLHYSPSCDDAPVTLGPPSSATAGVILAAGGGSRFAGPTHKLLADLDGRPLVTFALDNVAASGLAPLAIVTGAVELGALIPPSFTVLTNPDWEQGQATSLQVAVAWAEDVGVEALVVGLGDQPSIGPSAWRAVAEATASPVAVATYHGRRGHPVRLHRSVWSRLPHSGDVGARVLLAQSPELVTEVACDGDPADVDTVDDLARWR